MDHLKITRATAVRLAQTVRAAEEWSEHHDHCVLCRDGSPCEKGAAMKSHMDDLIRMNVVLADVCQREDWEQLVPCLEMCG